MPKRLRVIKVDQDVAKFDCGRLSGIQEQRRFNRFAAVARR
jgi:hypothetical protein